MGGAADQEQSTGPRLLGEHAAGYAGQPGNGVSPHLAPRGTAELRIG